MRLRLRQNSSRKSSECVFTRVRFLACFLFLCLVFSPFFFAASAASEAQAPTIIDDYPLASGIALVNSSGLLQSLLPIPGFPTDLEILPSQREFAVVTAAGEFMIFTLAGELVFNANFESLNDVDCAATDANQFLFASRTGNRIFYYNRSTGEQRDVPYAAKGPVDADWLPNGNLLLCEAVAGQVVEISPEGKIVWSYASDLKQPMDALRLPGGETLISDFDNHRVLIVRADGSILSDLRGFDHPSKLSLLSTGAVLIADSDQQEIEEIFSFEEHRVIRGKMNCIQSVSFLSSQNAYLCAVQQRFAPPQKQVDRPPAQAAAPISWVESIQSAAKNRYFLLTLSILLWIGGVSFQNRFRAVRWLLPAAYGVLVGFLFVFQTRAAADASGHRPDLIFWLGTLTLLLWVYPDASASYWPRTRWVKAEGFEKLPLDARQWVAFILVPFLSLAAQYYYLQATPFGWRFPWYVPMIVWGMTLYGFFRALTRTPSPQTKDHSTFRLGRVMVAVPFTTGSVNPKEIDEDPEGSAASEVERKLVEPWANSIFVLVLLLGAALYLIGATSVPTDVHGDEAEVALFGIQIRDAGNWNFFNLGWYQIPYFFFLIPSWVMWLFGDNLFGARAAGALIGLACIPAFYLLARRFLRPAPAAIAVFLFAASSYFVHFSRIGIGYNQTTLFTIAVMYGFARGLQDRDARWLCLSGTLCAIGSLSYQATKILTPLILSSMGLLWLTRALPWRALLQGLLAFFLAFWIGFAPLAGVYLFDKNAAFSRTKSVTLFSPEGEELLRRGYPADIKLPDLIKFQVERSLLAPIAHHDNSPYLINRNYGGMLDTIPAILFTAGFFLLLGTIRHPVSRLLLYWILCILLLGSAMTDHAPSYQRLVGLIPFLAIVAAPVLNGCLAQFAQVYRWAPRTRLHATAAVMVFLLVLGVHRYFHQIMSKPQLLDEWTRIAQYLNEAGPSQYTYFFGAPDFFFQYGTVRFLAPEAKGEDVLKADQFVKNKLARRGPVCFMMVRNNRRYINDLRLLYPGGREENHFNSEGGAPFTTYVVNF